MSVDSVGDGVVAAAADAALMGNVLESSTEYSIIATDRLGVIVLWNEGACRLYGYAPSEILGQPIALLHAHDTRPISMATMMNLALDEGSGRGQSSGFT